MQRADLQPAKDMNIPVIWRAAVWRIPRDFKHLTHRLDSHVGANLIRTSPNREKAGHQISFPTVAVPRPLCRKTPLMLRASRSEQINSQLRRGDIKQHTVHTENNDNYREALKLCLLLHTIICTLTWSHPIFTLQGLQRSMSCYPARGQPNSF